MKTIFIRFSLFVLPLIFLTTGCSSTKSQLEYENTLLKGRISQLERLHQDDLRRTKIDKELQINSLKSSNRGLMDKASGLELSRDELARSLAQEIAGYQAKLELSNRGLVVTFLQDILFDSGKAEIKEGAFSALSNVAGVIRDKAKDHMLVIEGYTDNTPIRHSNWKTNWDLSSARALSVFHYFVEKESIDPSRLSVMGNGSNRPLASNDDAAGRKQNRRVEIVIFPEKIKRVAAVR